MFSKIAVAVAIYAVTFVYGKNIIECTKSDECDNGQYTCDGSGCEIKCSGKDSCDDSRFYCTSSCTVECTAEYSCSDTNFYFTGGDVSVTCTGTNSCNNVAFYASNETTVSFECEATSACEDSGIYMSQNSKFSIECDGSYACNELNCYCKNSDNCETSGNLECHEDSSFDFFVNRMVEGLPKEHNEKRKSPKVHKQMKKPRFNHPGLSQLFGKLQHH